MRGGVLAGSADIQEFNRLFSAEQFMKFMWCNDRFAFGHHPFKSPAVGDGLQPLVFGERVNHQGIIHMVVDNSRF